MLDQVVGGGGTQTAGGSSSGQFGQGAHIARDGGAGRRWLVWTEVHLVVKLQNQHHLEVVMMPMVVDGGSGWVYTESSYNAWKGTTEGKKWLLNSKYYLTNASTTSGGHSGNGLARITTKPFSVTLYEKYTKGIYSDESAASTEISIPEIFKVGFAFDGFYTETGGNGIKLIDEERNILPAFVSSLFDRDSTIYANWIEKEINKLNYMTFTGKQCIDTKIIPDSNTKIEIKFELTNGPSNENKFLFGSRTNSNNANSFACAVTQDKIKPRINTDSNKDTSYTLFTSTSELITVVLEMDTSNLKANGSSLKTYSSTIATNTLNMYLGALNQGDSIYNPIEANIYYFKVWKSNQLVGNFIPIISKSGEYCFFDQVSETEFKNIGTGTFTGA